ncbi:MAG: undecaprenyl-diphosphate phosphatase [Thermoleophilia bacterium]|nr:undecaprenyl-diphosphate phosphatase [Thermoleophilia bacterium]
MNFFHAVVLGLVQGLTEFLPISSSGHLLIVPKALGWGDPGAAFTAIIQLGTMLAVLAYFREDLGRIFSGAWKEFRRRDGQHAEELRLFTMVALGTVPIAILGIVLKDQISHGARNLHLVAIALIVFGLVMELADRFGPEREELDQLTVPRGVLVGVAQALALVPGVSRSGATISMSRALGLKRQDAARFSFLLSIPAVVLSGLFELRDVGNGVDLAPTLVATVVAFVTGYASIAFLLGYLGRHGLTVFTVYRVALGIAVLALA